MKMKKVRQKPVHFNALQWSPGAVLPDGVNVETLKGAMVNGRMEAEVTVIHTPHGPMRITAGDWILFHPDGSFGSVPAEIFGATFEEVPT